MRDTNGQSAGKDIILSFLVGVYLGDGCVYHQEGTNNYIFRLSSIDEDFVKTVQKCFFYLIGKSGNIQQATIKTTFSNPNKKRTIYTYTVYSKRIFSVFTRLTKGKTKIPRMIKRTPAITRAFIAGLMDSEGYIAHYKNKWAFESGFCGSNEWVKEIKEILLSIGCFSGIITTTLPGGKKNLKKNHYSFHINVKSFIDSGCFFTIRRKWLRIIDASLFYNTTPPVNLVYEILRDFTPCSHK